MTYLTTIIATLLTIVLAYCIITFAITVAYDTIDMSKMPTWLEDAYRFIWRA